MHLAAGKLPQTPEHFVRRPLRDEDAIVGIDERDGDDEQERHAHGPVRMNLTFFVSLPAR
jgi:hypothetical protein